MRSEKPRLFISCSLFFKEETFGLERPFDSFGGFIGDGPEVEREDWDGESLFDGESTT